MTQSAGFLLFSVDAKYPHEYTSKPGGGRFAESDDGRRPPARRAVEKALVHDRIPIVSSGKFFHSTDGNAADKADFPLGILGWARILRPPPFARSKSSRGIAFARFAVFVVVVVRLFVCARACARPPRTSGEHRNNLATIESCDEHSCRNPAAHPTNPHVRLALSQAGALANGFINHVDSQFHFLFYSYHPYF